MVAKVVVVVVVDGRWSCSRRLAVCSSPSAVIVVLVRACSPLAHKTRVRIQLFKNFPPQDERVQSFPPQDECSNIVGSNRTPDIVCRNVPGHPGYAFWADFDLCYLHYGTRPANLGRLWQFPLRTRVLHVPVKTFKKARNLAFIFWREGT